MVKWVILRVLKEEKLTKLRLLGKLVPNFYSRDMFSYSTYSEYCIFMDTVQNLQKIVEMYILPFKSKLCDIYSIF